MKGRTPVPPRWVKGGEFTVVAEAPGKREVILEKPLVGPSGMEFDRALRLARVDKNVCSRTNVVLCRPDGNDLAAIMTRTRQRNKRREKKGLPPLLMPTEACRPRLLMELHQSKALFLMGKYARAAVFKGEGSEDALMKFRGFPEEVTIPGCKIMGQSFQAKTVPVLSTVHPAFVLRRRRWTGLFRSDTKKMIRVARGKLRWQGAEKVFFPKPDALANTIAAMERSKLLIASDLETDGKEQMECHLRCIGIGTFKLATCVPVLGINKKHAVENGWYTPGEWTQIQNIVRDFYGAEGKHYAGHNFENFDTGVLEFDGQTQFPGLELKRKLFDTVIAHHVVHSEHRHDLGFVTSQYTDARQHKVKDPVWGWQSDHQLYDYCMDDCATNSFFAMKLAGDERLRGQKKAYRNDMFLATFCRKLHQTGMRMDLTERGVARRRLTVEANAHHKRVQELALEITKGGKTKAQKNFLKEFNPNSSHQLRKLLFGMIGLSPVPEREGGRTDTGDPAVGKEQIFYLIDTGLPRYLEDLLLSVIDYRECIKLRGTYCDVEPWIDGRIHPSWNPHVAVTGRLSCSGPNLMNIRHSLRGIYTCEPGHILIGWDKAQLEARVTAWLAQQQDQIISFLGGADTHRLNAAKVLGIPNPEDVSDSERKLGKAFVFAVQYLAGKMKAWRMVKNFVDKKVGERPFRDLTFEQAELCFDNFWASRGSIMEWHTQGRILQHQQGYLEDAIHGRRRYFLDAVNREDEKEEKANFRVQGCHPKCVKLLTSGGLVPIGDVPKTGKVWDGNKWVAYTRLARGPWELAEIELKNGQILKCDTRHEVLVATEFDYSFKHFEKLQPGDRVCRSLERPLEFGDSELVDKETAYWLGFAVGNGSTAYNADLPRGQQQGRNHCSMTFGDRKLRYRKEEKANQFSLWLEEHGYHAQKPQIKSGSVTLRVEAKEFRVWWEEKLGYHWGATAHDKRIPSAIWRSDLMARKAFVLGLLDADGCVENTNDGYGRPTLHMCQRPLLQEVQQLLRTVGVRSRLIGPLQDEIESWRLNISKSDAALHLDYGTAKRRSKSRDTAPKFIVDKFLRMTNHRMFRKGSDTVLRARMRYGGTTSVQMLRVLSDKYGAEDLEFYATSEVVETRALGYEEETFTLSVDDPGHRFDSEGVISKNTAAADMNECTKRFVEEYPWGFAGPHTGICLQCHDEIVGEFPEHMAEEIAIRGQQILFSKLGDMPLPVDIGMGYNYRDLDEYKVVDGKLVKVD